jgi:Leucine-rich repeat (LRR) protein
MLIRRIHLSSNGIVAMEEGALRGLEECLEYLNLENNELTSLPSAVSSLKKISYLYLANNAMRELPNNSFAEFDQELKALSLAANGFEGIPVSALNGCSNLLHLNLGYNKIYRVEPDSFDWAENLEILLLRNNVLTQLKAYTFRGRICTRILSQQPSTFILAAMLAISNTCAHLIVIKSNVIADGS